MCEAVTCGERLWSTVYAMSTGARAMRGKTVFVFQLLLRRRRHRRWRRRRPWRHFWRMQIGFLLPIRVGRDDECCCHALLLHTSAKTIVTIVCRLPFWKRLRNFTFFCNFVRLLASGVSLNVFAWFFNVRRSFSWPHNCIEDYSVI